MISAARLFERRMATAPIRLDQTEDQPAYAAWGRALAALHNRPSAGAMRAPLPWVLSRVPRATGRAEAALVELLPVEQGAGSVRTGVADVVAWVSLSDPLSWALESAAAQWSATGWIHGEATRTHALFSAPERRRSARVQLICVGLSGLGDPDWDLATAYDSILGSGLPPSPYATAVLHAYALAEGPGRLRRDALAARMILTSLQIAAAASCSTPSLGTNTWGSRAMEHILHAERIAQDGLLGQARPVCEPTAVGADHRWSRPLWPLASQARRWWLRRDLTGAGSRSAAGAMSSR